MRSVDALCARLAQGRDESAELALLSRAVGCQSVTGDEAHFVAFLHDEMTKRGLAPQTAEFAPGRPNIWGARTGTGCGPRLLFVGHTDTVHVEGWREKWAGTRRADPFGAAIVDGALWGRGAADLKGGICACLAALDLVDRAGIVLAGELAFAFTGDEEGGGAPGTGVSAGIRAWVDLVRAGKVARPDFAVYVEPTQLSIYAAQIGFFMADVVITGKSAYFSYPELGVDALKATHDILSSIWRYAGRLAARGAHDLVGKAGLLVTGIEGGGYVAVPGQCRFSVIGTLRPGDDMDSIVAGFEKAVRDVPVDPGIRIDISYTSARDHRCGGSPTQVDTGLDALTLLSSCLSAALPGAGVPGGAPYWSESPFLVNGLGCPTVYCAPGDIRHCHTSDERIDIAQYHAAILAFAVFIVEYCGIQSSQGGL